MKNVPDLDYHYMENLLYSIYDGNIFKLWNECILETFEHDILLRIDDDDYHGDSRVLLKNENKYGILIFGYGTCSGCDVLLDCSSIEDVTKLRDKLYAEIRWSSSKEECLKYLNQYDWKGEFIYHSKYEKIIEFIKKAKIILS